MSNDTDIQECIDHAEELKREGNDHFRARRWDEAISSYRTALGQLPSREKRENETDNGKGKGRDGGDSENDDDDHDDDNWPRRTDPEEPATAESAVVPEGPPTEQDLTLAKTRAVLNANIGACHVKLVCFFENIFPGHLRNAGQRTTIKRLWRLAPKR